MSWEPVDDGVYSQTPVTMPAPPITQHMVTITRVTATIRDIITAVIHVATLITRVDAFGVVGTS
jgi:hypothetical protein